MKSIKINKYVAILCIFLLVYLFLLNYKLDHEFVGQEGKNSVQGFLFYDYMQYVLNKEYIGYGDYIELYSEKYLIGDYASYNPPVYPLTQGVCFLLFSGSVTTARLATQMMVVIFAFAMFFFAKKTFDDSRKGLIATVVFLLFPITFNNARLAYLIIPVGLCMAGWYYMLFLKEKISWISLITGAFFLLCATLMSYISMIYAGVFILVNLTFMLINKARKTDNFTGIIKQASKERSWHIFTVFIIQVMMIIIISAPWIGYSLQQLEKTNIIGEEIVTQTPASRLIFGILEQGIMENNYFGNIIFYFKEIITCTSFIALFALVVAYMFFIRKKTSFLYKHKSMLLFIAVVFFTAGFFPGKQIGFIIHLMPFITIFIVQGIHESSNWLRKRYRIKNAFVYVVVIISIALIFQNISASNHSAEELKKDSIEQPDELISFFQEIDKPALITYVTVLREIDETSADGKDYNDHRISSADNYIFKMMKLKKSYNPSAVEYHVLKDDILHEHEVGYFYRYLKSEISAYIILAKKDTISELGQLLINNMKERGFDEKNTPHYNILTKIQKSDDTSVVKMESNEMLRFQIYNHTRHAQIYLEEGKNKKAIIELNKIYLLNPEMPMLDSIMINTYLEAAEEELSKNRYNNSLYILDRGLNMNLSHQRLMNSKIHITFKYANWFFVILEGVHERINEQNTSKAREIMQKRKKDYLKLAKEKLMEAIDLNEKYFNTTLDNHQLYEKTYPNVTAYLSKLLDKDKQELITSMDNLRKKYHTYNST